MKSLPLLICGLRPRPGRCRTSEDAGAVVDQVAEQTSARAPMPSAAPLPPRRNQPRCPPCRRPPAGKPTDSRERERSSDDHPAMPLRSQSVRARPRKPSRNRHRSQSHPPQLPCLLLPMRAGPASRQVSRTKCPNAFSSVSSLASRSLMSGRPSAVPDCSSRMSEKSSLPSSIAAPGRISNAHTVRRVNRRSLIRTRNVEQK